MNRIGGIIGVLFFVTSCARIGFDGDAKRIASGERVNDLAVADTGTLSPDTLSPDTLSPDTLSPDTLSPDTLSPDTLSPDTFSPPTCPSAMARFGDVCIDKDQGSNLTWVAAVEHCMKQGMRLCSKVEWQTACASSGKGMLNMVGNWEWFSTLASATSGSKGGCSSCTDQASHSVTVGTYGTRCCKTLGLATTGMADFTTYFIDKDQSPTNKTWVYAAEDCMKQNKRLCSVTEFQTACNASGYGMKSMVGTYEWLCELASATSGKKAGSSSCGSLSSHTVTSGTYNVRCCYTP